MDNDLFRAAHEIRKGRLHRIHDGQGLRVQCLSGCLWLTQESDPRDVVLEAGGAFTIDRAGDTFVSALDESRFVVFCDPALTGRAALQPRKEPVAERY